MCGCAGRATHHAYGPAGHTRLPCVLALPAGSCPLPLGHGAHARTAVRRVKRLPRARARTALVSALTARAPAPLLPPPQAALLTTLVGVARRAVCWLATGALMITFSLIKQVTEAATGARRNAPTAFGWRTVQVRRHPPPYLPGTRACPACGLACRQLPLAAGGTGHAPVCRAKPHSYCLKNGVSADRARPRTRPPQAALLAMLADTAGRTVYRLAAGSTCWSIVPVMLLAATAALGLAALHRAEDDHTALRARDAALRAHNAALRADNTALDAAHTALDVEHAALCADLEGLRADLMVARAQANRLQAAGEELIDQLRRSQALVGRLNSQLAAARAWEPGARAAGEADAPPGDAAAPPCGVCLCCVGADACALSCGHRFCAGCLAG